MALSFRSASGSNCYEPGRVQSTPISASFVAHPASHRRLLAEGRTVLSLHLDQTDYWR